MKTARIIAALAAAALAVVVIAQNTESIETKLLWVTLSMPRALLLLVTLLVGFVLGILFAAMVSVRSGGGD